MPGTVLATERSIRSLNSQAVECVAKVDCRYHVAVRHGIYVAPGGVNCGLAPTWHPDSHLDRVEVVGKLTGGVTVGALGSDAA